MNTYFLLYANVHVRYFMYSIWMDMMHAAFFKRGKLHVMWAKNGRSRRDLRPTRFRFGGCFLSRTAGHNRSLLRPRFSHLLPASQARGEAQAAQEKLEAGFRRKKGNERSKGKNSLFWPLRAILQLV